MVKNKKKALRLLIGGLIFLLLLGAGGAWFYFTHEVEFAMLHQTDAEEVFLEGILVSDIALSGKTLVEAEALLRKKEPALRDKIDVVLTYGKKKYSFTEDDFKFAYDTPAVLKEAYQYGREGDLLTRFNQIKALREAPKNFPLKASLDTTDVVEKVAAIAAKLNRKKQEAKMLKFTPGEEEPFSYQKGHDGVTVDEEKTAKAMKELLKAAVKKGKVEIVIETDPCTTTTKDVQKQTQKIASFSTVSNNTEDARYNMGKALGRFNGTVLAPSESFSYNDVVGNSSLASDGWRSADTLSGGKVVQDYGGGVCQAATTLYGAVLRADLTIVERDCHRWPSSYVPIGQDATISYGNIDFQFKNPYDTPIYLEGYMTDGNKLNINIYGEQPSEWDTVKINSWQTETVYPDKTIKKEDPTLAKGEEETEVSSRNGSRAAGEVVFYKNEEEVRSESLASSYYAPVQGVVRVGTKADKKPAKEIASE